jgi:hypothetical protein
MADETLMAGETLSRSFHAKGDKSTAPPQQKFSK